MNWKGRLNGGGKVDTVVGLGVVDVVVLVAGVVNRFAKSLVRNGF